MFPCLELTGKSMRGNGARRATEHATEGVADPAVDEIGEQSK